MLRWMLASLVVVAAAASAVYGTGLLLPRTHVARLEGVVPRRPDEVAATIRDVRAYPRWRHGVRVEDVVQGPGGTTYVEATDERIAYRLTEPVPGREFVATITDLTLPFGGRWTITLTPDGAGTLVRIREDGTVGDPIYRFVARFVFGHTSSLDRYLRDLGASHVVVPEV